MKSLVKALFCSAVTLISSSALALKAQPSNASPTYSEINTVEKCDDMACKRDFRRLRKFARNGSPEAQFIVATMYINGVTEDVKIDRAIRYLKKSDKSGLGMASWVLSNMYKEGSVVEKDDQMAKYYFDRALARQVNGALFEKATQTLNLSHKNNQEPVKYLQLAANQQHKKSMYLLAQMYEFGEGIEQDLLKAAKLYKDLEFYEYKDSYSRFQNILTLTKADKDLYQKLKVMDVERIKVTGEKIDLKAGLAILAKALYDSGTYDSRGGFSRILGGTCVNSSSSCGFQNDPKRFVKGKRTF